MMVSDSSPLQHGLDIGEFQDVCTMSIFGSFSEVVMGMVVVGGEGFGSDPSTCFSEALHHSVHEAIKTFLCPHDVGLKKERFTRWLLRESGRLQNGDAAANRVR
jgi:hypothetical protein